MNIRCGGVILALTLTACGHGSATPDVPDVDAMPDAPAFVPGSHDPPPQVLTAGGPVLTAPKIVPIFFQNDVTNKTAMEAFLNALAASQYWDDLRAEYGVGELTILPTVVFSQAAPTTDDDLQTLLGNSANGTTLPTPDANTIYFTNLPDNAAFTSAFGSACADYGGYHSEISLGGVPHQGAIYVLLPRCDFQIGSVQDTVTAAASHEFFEAATDPLPFSQPAFQQLDPDHAVYSFFPELGDMCEFSQTAFRATIPGGFRVQRQWSNVSTTAGHDPCVTAPSTGFHGASGHFPDSVPFTDATGNPVMTKGLTVAIGDTKTLQIDLYSDIPTSDYDIAVVDMNELVFQQGHTLDITLDRTRGNNGDKIHATIKRTASSGGGNILMITSLDAAKLRDSVSLGLIAE